MSFWDLHLVDHLVVAGYFAGILYLGVVVGGRQTRNLTDYFVAGGKWGAVVSIVFIFASGLAGNEAVVISGKSYQVGLSGVWYWWGFLFATPIYYLFSTYYRRARVHSLADFLALRYGRGVAAFYAVFAGILTLLFIGMVLLAIGKIVAGLTSAPQPACVWTMALVVAAYIFAGGMMSSLLTDLVQGVMCLTILSFLVLPFLWVRAGGFQALKSLPPETWGLSSEGVPLANILALNASAIVGGIAAPWILPWIAVSRDERAATQCGWGHLWKRVVTVLFAFYGILFALAVPGLSDPEQAWGHAVREVLPQGLGLVGLLVASFFAAAMSSIGAYAITSSALCVGFIYRHVLFPGYADDHYLIAARIWSAACILIAAASTGFIGSIEDYVNFGMTLLSFLGVPILFGVAWSRANRVGTWLALVTGACGYVVIMVFLTGPGLPFGTPAQALPWGVFVPTAAAIVSMFFGSLAASPEPRRELLRFYAVMNTPVGHEQRLVDAGVRLPGLVAGEGSALDSEALERLYDADARDKLFGPHSSIELRHEREMPWYFPGFVAITLSCLALVLLTWFVPKLLFVWPHS